MERPRPSNVAWGILGAAVALYDYYAPPGETMSEAVDRALQKPLGRVMAIGAVAVTAAHLINLLPPSVDPIHKLAEVMRGER